MKINISSPKNTLWLTVLMVYAVCGILAYGVELAEKILPDFNPIHIFFEDFDFSDAYYKIRKDTTKINDIVIIDLKCAGRAKIAGLADLVHKAGAEAIGIDLTFDEAGRNDPGTDSMAHVLNKYPNIIVGYNYLKQDPDHFVIGDLKINKKRMGFINFSDSSKTIRIAPLTVQRKNEVLKSFALSMVNSVHPTDLDSTMRIRYLPTQNFQTLDIDKVLADSAKYDSLLRGSTVLFGETNRFGANCGNNDNHFTPLNPRLAGRSFPDMEGVYIHANVIRNINQGQDGQLTEVSLWLVMLILLIIFLPTLAIMIRIYCRPKHYHHLLMTIIYEPLVYLCYLSLCFAFLLNHRYLNFTFPYLLFGLSPLAIYLTDQLDHLITRLLKISPVTVFNRLRTGENH